MDISWRSTLVMEAAQEGMKVAQEGMKPAQGDMEVAQGGMEAGRSTIMNMNINTSR